MTATYVDFWRVYPGQRVRAFSYFARVKEAVERIGVCNVRYRRVMTGENAGLYYALHDVASLSEYGQILDLSATSPEFQSVSAEASQADSPVAYLGNWVMEEMARFGEPSENECAFIIRNWNVTPGREGDFLESAERVSAIMRQHGGIHVVYRIAFGGDMSGVYAAIVGFPDFASLYAFHEDSATSDEGKRIRQSFHDGTPPATSRSISTAVAVSIGERTVEQQSVLGC